MILGYGPSLSPQLLLDFVNQEGNVLLALTANSPTPTAISSLLLELDVHLSPDRTSLVVDHFNYDTSESSDKHDVLLLPRPGPLRSDVKAFFSGDGVVAVPRAVGQTLGNSSPLLAPILRAPVTAYSYNPKDEANTVEEPFATGGQLALISSVQARNSARFTVLGSVEMLENKWFDASVKGPGDKKAVKTVNRQFAAQLTEWTFKEVGVLKVGKVDHFLNAENGGKSSSKNVTQTGYLNPDIYRVKNDVVCQRVSTICISWLTITDFRH
jgi:oligosaccharyltransferase complex subunit beta